MKTNKRVLLDGVDEKLIGPSDDISQFLYHTIFIQGTKQASAKVAVEVGDYDGNFVPIYVFEFQGDANQLFSFQGFYPQVRLNVTDYFTGEFSAKVLSALHK